jgi:hypothetical protein
VKVVADSSVLISLREALIPSLAEALDACQEKGSFRISELLRCQALESVGEA